MTELSLRACSLVISKLKVDEERCKQACVPEIYAADEVLRLSAQGMPFREAYRMVAQNLDRLESIDPVQAIKARTHTGASGNLQLDRLARTVKDAKKEIHSLRQQFEIALGRLVENPRKQLS